MKLDQKQQTLCYWYFHYPELCVHMNVVLSIKACEQKQVKKLLFWNISLYTKSIIYSRQ